MTKKIVVIGGSAAGAKAAAKARRLDMDAQITIIQKDQDLSQASCGFPYYIGGTFDTRNSLLSTPYGKVRDPDFFWDNKRIKVCTCTEVISINRQQKEILCRETTGNNRKFSLEYDKLIYCTGARARTFPLPGMDQEGIHTLLSMEDMDSLHRAATAGNVTEAVVVGGGLIGVEACEALAERGIQVRLVEVAPQILVMLDWQLSALMAKHMRAKGVDLYLGKKVTSFLGDGKVTGVKLEDGGEIPCQLVVLSMGVQPNIELAKEAGIEIGQLGGIVVNEGMQTSDPDIFAAGDCVECTHLLTGKKVLAPMGDLANLQGRVAGENAALDGAKVSFPGTIQTAICKVFDWKSGVTGLTERLARSMGVADYETVVIAGPDKPGFMGAGILISKMLVDKANEKILGFQCVGAGDVSRQVASMSLAIQGGLTLTQLVNADMPYAPPFSLAIDHCIAAAHVMQNKLKKRIKSISAEKVWEKIQSGEKLFLVSGCEEQEYNDFCLNIGEVIIPIGEVHRRMDEFPEDKDTPIICFCKVSMRGYETSLILEHAGYTNVSVMEGGAMAWPY